ncbi:MAG: ATP-binding cassette domain-containing protein, partial [Oscillospiraceae bacterium]
MELEEIIIRRKASELSGWQQKRLCIARALTADPKIIVFDEAVSGLDMAGRKNILDLLKCIHNATGKTFLLITHDIDAAIYTSSRIAVMRDGKIFEDMRCNGDF